jgi:hypothetical protein
MRVPIDRERVQTDVCRGGLRWPLWHPAINVAIPCFIHPARRWKEQPRQAGLIALAMTHPVTQVAYTAVPPEASLGKDKGADRRASCRTFCTAICSLQFPIVVFAL